MRYIPETILILTLSAILSGCCHTEKAPTTSYIAAQEAERTKTVPQAEILQCTKIIMDWWETHKFAFPDYIIREPGQHWSFFLKENDGRNTYCDRDESLPFMWSATYGKDLKYPWREIWHIGFWNNDDYGISWYIDPHAKDGPKLIEVSIQYPLD